MALLPGLSLFLTLTDLINISLQIPTQPPRVEYIRRVREARIEDYPYQIALRANDEHRCGGSIISENEILTAAHCVANFPVNALSVHVGSSIHFQGEPLAVRGVAIHQAYNSTNLDCDIAILTLQQNLTFNRFVKPIELAETRPMEGALAVVTVWGILNDDDDGIPDVMTAVIVRLIDRESCRSSLLSNIVSNSMMCGRQEDFGRDPCLGDSGSPLVDLSTGKQVGLVSWGRGCSRPGLPTVYASVPDLIHSREVYTKS